MRGTNMYKITFWAMTYGITIGGFLTFFAWYATNHPTYKEWLYKLAPIQVLIGLFCLVGGALALFYPLGTEQFIGDLIPGATALIIGFWLSMTYMKPKLPILYDMSQKLTPYQLPLGLLAIGAAVVHYFFWGTKNFF
ncbi:MAG: hypothetical protein A3B70_08120 [Deltaproteobacteria bacterium RIFCSPHIGHO2_02_FULL_40_11]|nr:MAG: hypothetical protein A3B70_08120 [Deltaproteobacteria bacterium RIFCSPHIGHO2_02_FULL_40_11]